MSLLDKDNNMSISNSLLVLTFNLALKGVKAWLSTQGVEEVHPLVEEWIKHFFTGGGSDKTLPIEAIEETKEDVITSLRDLWKCPKWKTVGTAWGGTNTRHRWFTSLAGVIGSFNYTLHLEEKGVVVKCWDLWDFNKTDLRLKIDLEDAKLRAGVKTLASMLSIPIQEDGNTLTVLEEDLKTLNSQRQFYTRWDFFLSWEELGINNPEDYDWEKGGLPKTWLNQEAMKKAVKVLKGEILMNNNEPTIIHKSKKLPYSWESINYLRSLKE